ncbi:vomeronasal type-2 receptor 26-like [Pelobates cultripes]|uniref:Vomeronasal type-2 receptor 26-like n=1 Tax=Pelobates cultripes TaxID=61616 RepID=A0AAD1W3S3_PELCU|nr:vomeronasal type-2 receptor 26-like [Pelobates cultripes]
MHLDTNLMSRLSGAFPLDWKHDHLTFLGLKLTKNPAKLYHHNYVRMHKEFTDSMQAWKGKYLSWTGHIAAVKMSLIPKIQYLFRTLQIPLPKQYLKNMQHTINTFIWEGKKASSRDPTTGGTQGRFRPPELDGLLQSGVPP